MSSALARSLISKGSPALVPAMVSAKDASRSRPPFAPSGPSDDLIAMLQSRMVDGKEFDHAPSKKTSQAAEAARAKVQVQGAHYEVYVGASIKLYSSAKREKELRSMHDVNHRELRIAKIAATVADYLWPNCQTSVDEAIAASKKMSTAKKLEVQQSYQPPKVPAFLCFTSWIRNNANIRESFICTSDTRYKPRMSWYNPNDGMIPRGWLQDGLLADLAYYKPLTGTRAPEQKW